MSEPLNFRALLDDREFQQSISRMVNSSGSLTTGISQQTDAIQTKLNKLGAAVGIAFSFQQVQQFISDIARVRGEFQQLEITFGTMLGSKQQADEMLKQAVDIARNTPFGLKDVASGIKQLLAYGGSADTVAKELVMLGDVASGVSAPLKDILYLYGTLKTQGTAFTIDIRQFAGRGIPIYKELAKVMKTTEGNINALASAGKISFAEVEQAFKNMTSGSGQFANLMAKQSQSIQGNIERLGDSLDQMRNEIGKNNEGVINGSIQMASALIENYDKVGKVIATLVVAYGTYRAALIALSVVEKARAGMQVTETITRSLNGIIYTTQATRSLTLAESLRNIVTAKGIVLQTALNRVMAMNPYVAIAVGLTAVVGAMWAFADNTTSAERAQEKFNNELERTKKLLDDIKSQATTEISTIQNDSSTDLQKLQAYERLSKILPELTRKYSQLQIEQLKTADAEKLINSQIDLKSYDVLNASLTKSTTKVAELKREYQVLLEAQRNSTRESSGTSLSNKIRAIEDEENQVKMLKASLADLERQRKASEFSSLSDVEKVKNLEKQVKELEAQRDAIKQMETPLQSIVGLSNQIGFNFNSWRLNGITNQIEAMRSQMLGLQNATAPQVQDKSYFEGLKKKATENFEKSLPGTAEFQKYRNEISQLDAQLHKWSTSNTKVAKSNKEVFNSNSLAGINQAIQKIQALLDRVPVDQKNRISELQGQLLELEERRLEAQRVLEMKSFEDTLKAKRQEYLKFQSLIINAETDAEKSAIKAKFSGLTEQAKNYEIYLQSLIKPLKVKVETGEIDTKGIDNLILLTNELSTLTGADTTSDKVSRQIASIGQEAVTSVEKVAKLRDLLFELQNIDDSKKDESFYSNLTKINEAIEEETRAGKESLKNFLAEVTGSEVKRLAIVKKYANLRAQANNAQDIKFVNDAEKKELNDFLFETAVILDGLNTEILGNGRKVLVAEIDRLDKIAKKAKEVYGIESAEFKKAADEKRKADESLLQGDLAYWSELVMIVGSLGDEFRDMPGIMAGAFSFLSGVKDQMNNISLTFDAIKKGSKEDIVSGAVSGASSLIGLIVGAAKKRKAVRKEEEAQTLQTQLDLNVALLEEIRLRTELSSNPYVVNYYDKIRNAIEGMSKASEIAFNTLKQLNAEGLAKNGTLNKIDWSAVGTGASAGLSIGASVGTAVGGWAMGIGTAIGSVIGAIGGAVAGLFGAMKRDARYSGLFEIYPELITQSGELNISLAEILITNGRLEEETAKYLQQLIDVNEEWNSAKDTIREIATELTGSIGGGLQEALVEAFKSGEDSAKAFGGVVEDTLENTIQNLLFSQVFSSLFDTLGKDVENALLYYGLTGNTDGIFDTFAKFMEGSQDAINVFNELMEQAKRAGQAYDLSIFDDESSNRESLSGNLQSMKEETANRLEGLLNGIASRQIEQNNILSTQLSYLATMANMSRYNIYLERIDQRLARSNNEAWSRANGF